jgi:hypothetical protein
LLEHGVRVKGKKSKFHWNGKPIEDYSKAEIINFFYDFIKTVEVSISPEARDYINRLIQKDIDEQNQRKLFH